MGADGLALLLANRQWVDCRQAAEQLLAGGGLNDGERSAAYLALSRSLAALHSYQEALAPAELALYWARAGGDKDLLARTICHAAYVYHENRLYKRAAARLADYFYYYSLYKQARALEGWVLFNTAVAYRAMGRGTKALEYYNKAFRWHLQTGADPQWVEKCRANLAWQYLKQGEVALAEAYLEGSEEYLLQFPGDLDARARHANNLAYHAYMQGNHPVAMDLAARVISSRHTGPVRKAYAFLTLHYVARAQGRERVAMGTGVLARIQATVARRPDIEDEAVRALLHLLQDREELPMLEELLAHVGLSQRPGREQVVGATRRQDGAEPLPPDPAPPRPAGGADPVPR